ncbi:MAG: tetratricopeptide repeat protein [Planctomycetota bacterium]
MGRREVAAAVERRGARLDDAAPTVVVLGEDATDAERAAAAELADAAGAERISESDLWRRLGLVEHAAGVARLYTPSMVADLADVPLSAIRRWVRRGALRPACRVKHLAYFALDEVRVARLLSRLLRDGRSLASIDHAIDAARREAAAVGCPLSALSLAVVDGLLIVHRQDGVAEAGGQRRLDFADGEADAAEVVAVLPLTPAGPPDSPRDRAWALSEAGEPHAAIEALRLAMLESRPTAEDHFTLGDWLYELGDTPAARERYYAALELEPEHSEARLNLGCLFVDAGEIDLAIAAFRGVLDQHENLADAHYHLARLLDERGDSSAARDHWRRLLDLAPDGPWADDARASIRLV